MTPKEYWEKVDLIESRNPHEILLSTIKTGHSAVNEVYLGAALKRLRSMPAPQADPEPEEEIEVPEEQADETLRGLWRERTSLFGEMNKLSNKFHDCKTDDQRAKNSKHILHIWQQILAVKANMAYYKAHKSLPEPISDEDELPENPVALSKKLNSIRARISQKKQVLREIAALDEHTEGKAAKIQQGEDDLKRLKHLAGLAEQKLKAHEQA